MNFRFLIRAKIYAKVTHFQSRQWMDRRRLTKLRERSKLSRYRGRVLGKICLKKVFAPFFSRKKSSPPLFFLKKKVTAPFFRWKESSPPNFFRKKVFASFLTRPGYPINFDPSLRWKNMELSKQSWFKWIVYSFELRCTHVEWVSNEDTEWFLFLAFFIISFSWSL